MHLGVLEQYNVDLKEFAFKEKLGNGTQGEVQKVVHIQSQHVMAMKVIQNE